MFELKDKFVPIIVRGLSVSFRIILIIYIPKLLIDNEYNRYALFVSLVSVVSTTSGIGLPVLYIKKFALAKISRNFYLKYVTPISLLSGVLIYIVSFIFLPVEFDLFSFVVVILIALTEILVLEFLRLYQAKSDIRRHLSVSLIKSGSMTLILLLVYFTDTGISLEWVLGAWIFSNIITVLFVNPKLKEIFAEKRTEKVFTKGVFSLAILYFISYVADRYVLYYDKVFFFKNFGISDMVSLNILFLVYQSAFSLVESTLFLRKYNDLFNSKFEVSKRDILGLVALFLLFSISLTLFLHFFYNKNFGERTSLLHIMLSSFIYFIVTSLSWVFNIKNYSTFSAKHFVVLSLFGAALYIFLIYISVIMGASLFYIPLLYPLAYFVVHKMGRSVLHS